MKDLLNHELRVFTRLIRQWAPCVWYIGDSNIQGTGMSNIAVAGAAGRMGRQLLSAVFEREDVALGGATEHPASDAIGTDAGLLTGSSKTGIILTLSLIHI